MVRYSQDESRGKKMAKTMKSFRLDKETCIDLEAYSEMMGISQAEMISQMIAFMSECGAFSGLEIVKAERGYTPKNWAAKACKDGEVYSTVKNKIYTTCM